MLAVSHPFQIENGFGIVRCCREIRSYHLSFELVDIAS